jgi:hypothetical protein
MFGHFFRRGPKPTTARLNVEPLESRDAPAVLNAPFLIATGVQDRPESASNAAGTRVVVWTQKNGVADTDIWAQRFNNLDNKVGQPIRVTTTPDNESEPDVCVDPAGNFTVSYTRSTLTGSHLELARFNVNGVFLERIFVPSTSGFMNERDSHLACSAAGTVISYTQVSGTGEQDVLARTYTVVNGHLTQQRLIFVANQAGVTENDSDVARVAALTPPGVTNFVIAYVVNGDVLARRFDSNGNLLNPTNPVIRVANTTFIETDPSISANASGRFVVAWEQKTSFFAGNNIAARTFDSNGVLGVIRNVQTAATDDTAPEVRYINATQYLISYRSEQMGLFVFQVNVSRVTEPTPTSLTATVQTQLVTAQSFTGAAVGFSTIAFNPANGNYLLAYSQPGVAGLAPNLVGQIRRFV